MGCPVRLERVTSTKRAEAGPIAARSKRTHRLSAKNQVARKPGTNDYFPVDPATKTLTLGFSLCEAASHVVQIFIHYPSDIIILRMVEQYPPQKGEC